MAGSLSPEAGRSRGGGCNRGLCAEKWGTLSPQLFPSSPSSPCLETLVTSPVAQSLRVKVSPRKWEQSQNTPSLLCCHQLSASLRSSPLFPSPRLAAGTAIHGPPPTHPGGSLSTQGRSPVAGVSREQGLGDNSSEGMEQGRTHRYTRAQGGLGKHQPGVSEHGGGGGTGAASSSCPAPGTMKHSGEGCSTAWDRTGIVLSFPPHPLFAADFPLQ